MRLTNHNGRGYGGKHNDRNFDLDHAGHIDGERSGQNLYWHCYQSSHPELTFEQAEHLYYDRHFTAHLDEQNCKHIKSRHTERCKDYLDYYRSKRTCPEETIVQVGSKQDGSIDGEKLWELTVRQVEWEHENFPQVKHLSMALHMDETTPHIHIRKVWQAEDEQGHLCVSQAKALEQMGVRDPEGRRDRYHNPKIEYSRQCREHFLELCREHGLEIEQEPREASQSGLTMLEYQRRQEQSKILEAREELQELKDQISRRYSDLARMETVSKPIGTISLALKILTHREQLDAVFDQAEEYVRHREDFKRLDDADRLKREAERLHSEAVAVKEQAERDAEELRQQAVGMRELEHQRELSELRSERDRAVRRYQQAKDLLAEQYGFDLDKTLEQAHSHHRSR